MKTTKTLLSEAAYDTVKELENIADEPLTTEMRRMLTIAFFMGVSAGVKVIRMLQE